MYCLQSDMMLFRMASILLMFYIVLGMYMIRDIYSPCEYSYFTALVMSESSKNKADGLLRTTSKNGITTGKTFHVDDTKKRPAKFKR